MYTFQGVKVTQKRFWELSEIAKDLLILEQELDKEEGRKLDESKVNDLILEAKALISKKNEFIEAINCGAKVKDLILDTKVSISQKKEFIECQDCGAKVKDLILEAKASISQKDNFINCDNCGSKLVLSKSKWGPYLRCSNILKCTTIMVIK